MADGFGSLEKIADRRVAIRHRGPRDVADGRWSEGEFDAAGAAVEALDSSPPSWSPRPWDVEIRLTLYRAVIFAGNAYPALTRTHLAKNLFPHP